MPLPVVALARAASAQEPAGPRASRRDGTFGASYDDLSTEQRALIDGLFQRAGTILGVKLDPRQRYDSAPLSSRTTFDAVSHALLGSVLTDRVSGQPLGRALDLIDHIETVHGQVDGAEADKQFRLYVVLKPGAREKLDRSSDFKRGMDNTFFHEGYPLSYRQDNGSPSVQISMSPDATRADIDIDYRASRFPVSLVNGHLTAANSDVRAGNLERHNGRWSGLVNWWDGIIRSVFVANVDVPADAPQLFPDIPRAGSKTIDVAVDDFLTSWLVEDKPNLAVAYLDRAAYDCLAERLEQEGQTLDRGLAPLQMYVRMKAVTDSLGPRQSLAGTTTGVRLTDPALRRVRHKRPDRYSIFGVPRAMAERWSCSSDMAFGVVPATPSALVGREVYETFYSAFTIGGSEYATAALGLLWQRRNGQWKIVSYQPTWIDAGGTQPIPDLRRPAARPALAHMTAEPALSQQAARFLEAWLVRKNYDEALAIVSPQAYACVNLYLEPGEVQKTTTAEQLARLRSGMERVAAANSVDRLERVIEHVDPTDQRLQVVEPSYSNAFSLMGAPDRMGPTFSCEAQLRGDDIPPPADSSVEGYGNYFVLALRFVNAAGTGDVLALAWARNEQGWRIYSFKIMQS
jgi:hypothetical protein